MPELPEVETVRRDLETRILHKCITRIQILHSKSVRSDASSFHDHLLQNSIRSIDRIGKLLIFHLSRGNDVVLCHLKMTGQLIYDNRGRLSGGGHSLSEDNKDLKKLPNQWTRIMFTFADKSHLYFNDLRLFGFMKVVSPDQLETTRKKFGIEPLTPSFTFEAFCIALGKRKTSIKAALLNQSLFAGIGNIYADESCFIANILPNRAVHSLTVSEKKQLFQAIQKIIHKAILRRGTTFSYFVDAKGRAGNFLPFLQVYRRAKKTCRRCKKGIIEKMKVAGRGTHFCPQCQT